MTTWIPIEQADIDWDAEPPMSYRLILLLPNDKVTGGGYYRYGWESDSGETIYPTHFISFPRRVINAGNPN